MAGEAPATTDAGRMSLGEALRDAGRPSLPPAARRAQSHWNLTSLRRVWTPEPVAEGLWVNQPRPGYRFSTDPFLLAGWVIEAGLPGSVLDVGTGSGVLGLLLARQGARVHGLDVQSEWAPHVRDSARRSGLTGQFTFEHGDIRTWAGRIRPRREQSAVFPSGPATCRQTPNGGGTTRHAGEPELVRDGPMGPTGRGGAAAHKGE